MARVGIDASASTVPAARYSYTQSPPTVDSGRAGDGSTPNDRSQFGSTSAVVNSGPVDGATNEPTAKMPTSAGVDSDVPGQGPAGDRGRRR
ncbi:hypothetical protein, partial [Kutzneria sp. 744]|uniref:hypothetical protein n=1 Tax=Kutzneria sp. (strain 744) TaxID=345341 RepID=UPI0018DE3B21